MSWPVEHSGTIGLNDKVTEDHRMSQLVINVYAVMCELHTWGYISEWRDERLCVWIGGRDCQGFE